MLQVGFSDKPAETKYNILNETTSSLYKMDDGITSNSNSIKLLLRRTLQGSEFYWRLFYSMLTNF